MKKLLFVGIALLMFAGCGKKVITTNAGLKYTVDTTGNGNVCKSGDLVTIHFKAWIIKDSSNLFKDWSKDSTRMPYSIGDSRQSNQPYKFLLGANAFVKGSDEGIVGMKKGETRTVIIPARCAYGERGFGPIPPNSNLKLVVSLIDMKAPVKVNMWDVDSTKLQTTKSGLKYVILQQGNGPKADSGKTVVVHYSGYLLDGTRFDSSVERDEPFSFVVGMKMVIPGWEEGIALLNKGSKARFIIPSSLAYGPRQVGKIPANSSLIFDVELMDVR
jgi:peptidylprolyl isomerase